MTEHGTTVAVSAQMPAQVLDYLRNHHPNRLLTDLWPLAQVCRALLRLSEGGAPPGGLLCALSVDDLALRDWELALLLPGAVNVLSSCYGVAVTAARERGVRPLDPLPQGKPWHYAREFLEQGERDTRPDDLPLVSAWSRVELLSRVLPPRESLAVLGALVLVAPQG